MKRAFLIPALAVLAAATATGAWAHDGKGRGGMGPRVEFSQLDSNGDGKITQAELSAHMAARFAGADTDGDGALSAEELAAHRAAQVQKRRDRRIERMLERFDSDGDGKLSLEEIQRRGNGSPMIERLDSDGDGAVSEAEFADMGKHRRKGWGRKHRKED